MEYFPIFIDLKGKNVLVIGNFKILEFKIEKLLRSGATVRYLSDTLPEKLKTYHIKGKLVHYKSDFQAKYLNDVWLVICGSHDQNLKKTIIREAGKHKIFCNFVDEPALCSFISPAVIEKGDITIAVSTGGKSPALTKYLKKKIDGSIGDAYKDLAVLLGKVRQRIQENVPDQKQRSLLFDAIIEHPRIFELIKSNQKSLAEQEAYQLIDEVLEKKISLK